jgi:hypothetical protein
MSGELDTPEHTNLNPIGLECRTHAKPQAILTGQDRFDSLKAAALV